MRYAEPRLLDVVDRVVASAGAGEQVEAYAAEGTSTTVRAYDGDVEAFTSATSRGIGIRVIVDGRQGFAHAGSLDDDIVADALREARDNLTFAEPDECNGLAEPDGVAEVDVPTWSDEVGALADTDRIERAIRLERAVRNGDDRITGVRNAIYGDRVGSVALATSTGIRSSMSGTGASVGVSALAAADGETTTGYAGDGGLGPSDVDDDEVARLAVERATQMLGADKPASGRIRLVLEPRMAATFLAIVAGMLSGDRVAKGRSPFADRVRDEIGVSGLTLVDDPTDARSLAASSADDEGLASRRLPLLTSGRLEQFVHNTYSARRAGTSSTASAVRGYASTPGVSVRALAVEPGAGTHEELVAQIDEGLLVTSFAGLHSGVNAISGDFSVGVEGRMIRAGALAEPIREATVASTVQKMLTNISAIGADLEWLPSGTGSVTLVIDDVSLSGT